MSLFSLVNNSSYSLQSLARSIAKLKKMILSSSSSLVVIFHIFLGKILAILIFSFPSSLTRRVKDHSVATCSRGSQRRPVALSAAALLQQGK